MTAPTSSVATLHDLSDQIQHHIGQVMIGKQRAVEMLLVGLLCEGHILLEDVPGVGKTTLIRTLARTLDLTFRRIQFTPDLLPTDVTGLSFFNQKHSEFEFRPGPIFTQLLLADEINRATPRTQSALLEAMQERTVTIDGATHPLPRPFLVLATQNPVELEGTFPLPEAQLDRFLLRIELGYPSQQEEEHLITRFQNADPLIDLAPITDAATIAAMQRQMHHVLISDVVRRYIVALVRATRTDADIELGVSPRGTLALAHAAQALAAVRGRTYVLPDDVKDVALAVLTHRLILNAEARLRGRTATVVLTNLLASLPVPVEEI